VEAAVRRTLGDLRPAQIKGASRVMQRLAAELAAE
jgi:hypothetical protein